MFFNISWGWIILATVVYFGVGALWYSPVMFAKMWMEEIKLKKNEMTMAAPAMVTTALAELVLVLVAAYLVHATGTHGWLSGARLGLLLWLGFAATTALVNSTFQ